MIIFTCKTNYTKKEKGKEGERREEEKRKERQRKGERERQKQKEGKKERERESEQCVGYEKVKLKKRVTEKNYSRGVSKPHSDNIPKRTGMKLFFN